MRNLGICERCEHYLRRELHLGQKDGVLKIIFKYYCQVDTKGLVMGKRGFSFKECDTKKEEFIALDCPERCPYKLEHLLIKEKENGN